MSLIWMIIAGLLAAGAAKLLMPHNSAPGIFLLGISGAIIAGVMEYSERIAIGFIGPFVGAVAILLLYAVTARTPIEEEKAGHEDFRRAA
jgi:uncharacterized membrane protein YeaQ/YmgE (transglycosylase-associated protein family)